MKIAYVSDAIYPYNVGGKEKRIFEVTTRLARKGYDIHIYCMNWWQGPKDREENGVHLHAICRKYPLYSGKRRSMTQALMFGLSCLKLIKEDFDIVDVDHMPHFPLFSMKTVCLLKRKKMIATWHEVWGKNYWLDYLGWRGIFGYLIEKIGVFMADSIITDSSHTMNRLKNILKYRKNIYNIPIGNDFEKIQIIESAESKSDIIFAGRLLNYKNIDVLIKAVQLIKETKPAVCCLIIGDGPEKTALEELSERLKLENNIKFLGFLENHEDVYGLMKSSRVFVLPSTREGFGIVVIEANACGLPVITTGHKDNAAKDLIEEGRNGFVCQLNEKEIAERILKILENSSDLKVQTEYVDFAKKYDWDNIVDEIEKVYLRLNT